jgi:flagellar hook-length control protein FliK
MAADVASETSLPAGVANQMIDAIRLQWSAGGGTARIQLDPSHFGELSVSVRVEQGQVTAHLEASSPVVREWLQTHHASLRSGLADHNLSLDRLEVRDPHDRPDAQRRREEPASPRDARRPKRTNRPDTGELFEVVA